MRTVWVTRSFLDYRVPVYHEVFKRCSEDFYLVYNANEEVVPSRVQAKINRAIGNRAIALHGERCLGRRYHPDQVSGSATRFFYQPGLIKSILALEPDIIITDAFNHWTIPVLYIRAKYGIPHVMCYERTVHTERNAQWYKRAFRSWALRYVDAMCVNGRLCKEYALGLGMPAERCTLGNMAADTDGLKSALQLVTKQKVDELRRNFSINQTCLLYVGRLTAAKGLRQLLHGW